ncbi:uncharacterized protein LOC126374650 [Pectinophora gossypiella]|uniref:uncharacterized protein LOC126374650 n=1 Tax=Pectinophora gossypiella TaxID=13191 RepID=UPI00214EA1EE|nr:uncharacterized protein LOC126374650 [Pectinophora gossypiella]
MFLCASVVFVLIGTVAAREPDIDINRIRLLREETATSLNSSHERRSISEAYQFRTNDYDDHSSGHFGPPPSLRLHIPKFQPKTTKAPIKVHQPREDPRVFYQSASYIKEVNGQDMNNEITYIYPGREVIRANEVSPRSMPIRQHNIKNDGHNLCIRCPHDRTLVARAGSNRVLLQNPRLFSCSGHKASRNVRYVHMYGPKFGSLVEQGSHMIVGRIMYKNKNIQLCKMQVHVVVQGCVTPKYLTEHCKDRNCNFTCRDPKLELYGQSSLACGPDMKWTGELPICRVRTWCKPPPPPEHGRLSCKGAMADSGAGLVEGAKCRVRCAAGWRWHPRSVAVCRRGAWTTALTCQKTNKSRL